jgi:hypothetical protein
LSRTRTMVWLSWMGIGAPYSEGRCRWRRALSAAVQSAGEATAAQPLTKSTS